MLLAERTSTPIAYFNSISLIELAEWIDTALAIEESREKKSKKGNKK